MSWDDIYTHYIDPEDEPEWVKEHRVLTITPYHFGARVIVDVLDVGKAIPRRYNISVDSPSAHRLQHLANSAYPETNGLITTVQLVNGAQIIITRPGWVEEVDTNELGR